MRLRPLHLLFVWIALILPANALAAGVDPTTRTFDQTYPVASKLCAEASQNPPLPSHPGLQPDAAQVVAACGVLQAAFNTAQANYKDRCAQAIKNHPRRPKRGCPGVRRQYFRAIEASRRQFWNTIRQLRGGDQIQEDNQIQDNGNGRKPRKPHKQPKPPKPAKQHKQPKPPKPPKQHKQPKPPKPPKPPSNGTGNNQGNQTQ